MLDSQRPALCVGLVEVRCHLRVVAPARVNSAWDIAQMLGTYIATEEPGSREAGRSTCGCRDHASVDDRGCGCHVQEHVVVRGVVSDPEAATDDGLRTSHAQKMRIPREANARAEVLIVIRDFRERRNRSRKRGIPERIRTRLICYRQVVEKIDCLA